MGKAKTVLVVDDSPDVLDQLGAAFERAGYDVASAADGEEVFRKMAALAPGALLVDVYMPKVNGADVCRLLKLHPRWKDTFLVLMSARLSDDEAETYRRIGADAILRKPFDASAAVDLVRRAIGAPERADR